MILIFDYDELQYFFSYYKPLPDVIHLTELIHILLINQDECDKYQKANIWQAIESSEVFNNEDILANVTDEYLILIDQMVELFAHELFNHLNSVVNIDIMNIFITSISFTNNSLVIHCHPTNYQ